MKIYDISLPISSELITWPGDPRPQLDKVLSISEGDACNVTKLEMGVHTGTHIDSPNHFIEGGITTDSMQLEVLMGKCLVIEITSKSNIQVSDLCNYEITKYERLLLKTSNSAHWENNLRRFDKRFIALSLEAAEYLVKSGIKLIGIDYLSIESYGVSEHKVHHQLLGNQIAILEGLNLSKVDSGEYELICLPLKLVDCDGAPVRAILKELT
jgi:arylformamidase